MRENIAVATVSGKAYYLVVSELKKHKLPFLSLKPQEDIPLGIKVVITTEEEHHFVRHPHTLIFKVGENPEDIVNEAIRIVKGKTSYARVVVGVDPGKTFGIAVVGDGELIETVNCQSIKEAVSTIAEILEKNPASFKVVKVGNGVPEYLKYLLDSLDRILPEEVEIKTVEEAGTTRLSSKKRNRRALRDMLSAAKIAVREGKLVRRKLLGEKEI